MTVDTNAGIRKALINSVIQPNKGNMAKYVQAQYQLLPGSYTEYVRHGGRIEITGRCKVKSLPVVGNGANPRDADLAAAPVRDMRETLTTLAGGRLFAAGHSGIAIVAKSAKFDSATDILSITVDPEEGGCFQGNHTQSMIGELRQMEDVDKRYPGFGEAEVPVSFYSGYRPSEIVDISIWKNNVRKHKAIDKFEALGAFDKLFAVVPAATMALIRRRSGDKKSAREKPYTAMDLIQRLAVFDNILFPAVHGVHPVRVYERPAEMLERFVNKEFDYLIPRLNDFLKLDALIAQGIIALNGNRKTGALGRLLSTGQKPRSIWKKERRLNGTMVPARVDKPWVLPILAAFRTLLKKGKWKNGMTVDTAWATYGAALIAESWRQQGLAPRGVNRNNFGRLASLWIELANIVLYPKRLKATKVAAGKLRVVPAIKKKAG